MELRRWGDSPPGVHAMRRDRRLPAENIRRWRHAPGHVPDRADLSQQLVKDSPSAVAARSRLAARPEKPPTMRLLAAHLWERPDARGLRFSMWVRWLPAGDCISDQPNIPSAAQPRTLRQAG